MGTYFSKIVVVERHLTLRVYVFEVPPEALALEALAQRLALADVTDRHVQCACSYQHAITLPRHTDKYSDTYILLYNNTKVGSYVLSSFLV